MNKTLTSQQLFSHVHRTWECYSQSPLNQVADNHYEATWAEDLDWFAAKAKAPNDCALLFGIDPVLGLLISGEMFDRPTTFIDQADVHDALGELTHIVARTITADLGINHSLQTPVAVTTRQRQHFLNAFNVESEMLAQSDHHYFYSALVSSKAAN
ncbi:hypothetical protein [Halioxenophilus aromaticivorans]|uniref:Uncharacterized protein n=1 Tax=Halioxenophilus aromaticivorans TaxID=1306992 RepID=A0AAV3U5X2_9ALTE